MLSQDPEIEAVGPGERGVSLHFALRSTRAYGRVLGISVDK